MGYQNFDSRRTLRPWMKYAGLVLVAVAALGVAAYALLR
jgi:hypothetical protein